MSKESRNPQGLSGKAIFKLYLVYWALFGMLATLACFSISTLMQPTGIIILAIASLIVPAIATFGHVRKGKKDGIDDIAKRMP